MEEQEIFNPIITSIKSGAQIEAENMAQVMADRFSREWLEVIGELIWEIWEAQFASRFKREISSVLIGQIISCSPLKISQNWETALKDNWTLWLKKLQLESDLLRIQSDLLSLSDRLKSVVMDIKASQVE